MKRLALVCGIILAGWQHDSRAENQPSAGLSSVLQPYVHRGELAGAVILVANKDSILAKQTFGYADVSAKEAISKDALFWVASMTKPMTATALMMLVEEGKVKLDDPVEKYLPEFKGQMYVAEKSARHQLLKKSTTPLRVRNLLNHTSGLPYKSAIETPTWDMIRLATVVRSYAAAPLVFEPESRFAYSNANTNTAGRIIEVVSGMSYEAFMEKRLFEPLGMKESSFRMDEPRLKRLAKMYKPSPDKTGLVETPIVQLHQPLTDLRREGMPASGLFTSAGDIAKFCQMILNDGVHQGQRLIGEQSIRLMTARQMPGELKENYGYCWTVYPKEEGFGHGSASNSNMSIFPSQGIVTVYMVQHSGFPGKGVGAGNAFRDEALRLFGQSKTATKP
jgi:CubicO group peptidase (beta-lactamase class C family)